jgi:mannose-6-phosphate isomerase
LTQKHVDVGELLRILSFDNGTPQVLDGGPGGSCERVYRTPSEDFELSRIDLATSGQYLGQAAHGPDSIIVLDGAATLTAQVRNILLARGAIVLVPFGTHYSLNAGITPAMLFKASVPGQTDVVPGSK